MKHLILVPGPGVIIPAALARFARRSVIDDGWRAHLAALLDAPGLAQAAPAEIAWAGLRSSRAEMTPERSACFASPVHIHIGRYGGRLAEPGTLAIDPSVQEEIVASFSREFADSDRELVALSDGTFLLLLSGLAETLTVDPNDCTRDALDDCLPTGPGAAMIRRISTELEMWLHTLSFNNARLERGLAPVTTLWLWGCGPRAVTTPAADAALAVYSHGPFLRGVGAVLGARIVEETPVTIDTMLQQAASRALASADTQLIDAAVAAVRNRAIKRLDVLASGAALTLRRLDLYKLWRRAPRDEGPRT